MPLRLLILSGNNVHEFNRESLVGAKFYYYFFLICFWIRCELRIVSDANKLFIETILVRHGLLEYFSEINTNPCYVDEEGRLRILPYHDHNIVSVHGCNLCPPNMCKVDLVS